MNHIERRILLASMLVTLVTGSIHCFSVILIPLESLLALPRAQISLFYSFALIFLTVSVLFGHRIYDKVRPVTMIVLACSCAGMGLLISAFSSNWSTIFLGYSVLFGTANGIAYGYVLQLVGRTIQSRKGFAMAAVTAAYAVGSVIFSVVLAWLVESASLATALVTMGIIIISGGVLAGRLIARTGVFYNQSNLPSGKSTGLVQVSIHIVTLLWVAYGCAVLSGLMAIGHAAGIVQALGGEYGIAICGSVFIGVGSAVGGFFIGSIINALNMNKWLVFLPLLSSVFLLLLIFANTPLTAIFILSVIGFSYGAVIAVYPFTVSVLFGDSLGPKVYGQVFTAWGFAGLAGPWIAGKLFDISGQYTIALIISSMLGIISALGYRRLINRSQNILQN